MRVAHRTQRAAFLTQLPMNEAHVFRNVYVSVVPPHADAPGRRQDTREGFHAVLRWIRRLVQRAAGQALPKRRSTLNGLVSEPRLLTPSPAQTLSAAG